MILTVRGASDRALDVFVTTMPVRAAEVSESVYPGREARRRLIVVDIDDMTSAGSTFGLWKKN